MQNRSLRWRCYEASYAVFSGVQWLIHLAVSCVLQGRLSMQVWACVTVELENGGMMQTKH